MPKEKKPTPGSAVRLQCLDCLGANTAGTAFDCRSATCPLYPCHPFRGRERDDTVVLNPREGLPEKRQPSRALIRAMCKQCQDHREDCGLESCALFLFRPWQKGGGRRELTDEQREGMRARALEQMKKGTFAFWGPPAGEKKKGR